MTLLCSKSLPVVYGVSAVKAEAAVTAGVSSTEEWFVDQGVFVGGLLSLCRVT